MPATSAIASNTSTNGRSNPLSVRNRGDLKLLIIRDSLSVLVAPLISHRGEASSPSHVHEENRVSYIPMFEPPGNHNPP